VSVSYVPNADKIADFQISHAGQSEQADDSTFLPGSVLVHSIAASTVSDVVSKLNSLTMHTQRSLLESKVKEALQEELNQQVPGFFRITRVVVTNLNTDPSIEQSIRLVVQNEKRLEAMTSQEAIARKSAEIKVIEAHGIADSNAVINNSLTREYLQHETNIALQKFAENDGTKTVLIPANIPVSPLISTN
jgi:SPFH domain/Band 7 family protein